MACRPPLQPSSAQPPFPARAWSDGRRPILEILEAQGYPGHVAYFWWGNEFGQLNATEKGGPGRGTELIAAHPTTVMRASYTDITTNITVPHLDFQNTYPYYGRVLLLLLVIKVAVIIGG